MAPTPIPTYNFGKHTGELINATLNQTNVTTIPRILIYPLTDFMGYPLTIGLIFFAIAVALFLRHEEGTLLAVMGIIVGGSILYMVPPEFRMVANAFFILILGGTLYMLIKKKGA